ncbi:MAG: hypothetical protein RI920_1295 [Pseudomonadota bacterium]|jgi:hypothetical protein
MSNHPFAFARRLIAVCAGMALMALASGAAHAEGSGRTASGRPAPIRGQVGVEAAQPPGQSVSSAREVPAPKDWQDLPAAGVTQVPSAPAVHDAAVVRQVATNVPAMPEPAHARGLAATEAKLATRVAASRAAHRQAHATVPTVATPRTRHVQPEAKEKGGALTQARRHDLAKPSTQATAAAQARLAARDAAPPLAKPKGHARATLVAGEQHPKQSTKRQVARGAQTHDVAIKPSDKAHRRQAAAHLVRPHAAQVLAGASAKLAQAKGSTHKRTPVSATKHAAKAPATARQALTTASKAHPARSAAHAQPTTRLAQAKAKAGRNKPAANEPHAALAAKAPRQAVSPRAARKVSVPADAMPQGPRRHRPVA